MKRSECTVGMWIMARLPGDFLGLLYPAKIRALSAEDVHVEWGTKAQAQPRPLPVSIGYQDIIRVLKASDVIDPAPPDGQAPATSESPATFPVDLDDKPRKPYTVRSGSIEAKAQDAGSGSDASPGDDLPSDEIRDQESWPLQWCNFQRVVRERRRILRAMRDNMRVNYLFTSVVDAVEAAHKHSQLQIRLAENHLELTKIKLNVLALLDEHYDYDPSLKTGHERPGKVDESPASESP